MIQPREGGQDAGRAAEAVWAATKHLANACNILAKAPDDSPEGPKLLKHLMDLIAIKDRLRGQGLLFGPTSPMSRKPKKRSRAGTPAREAPPQDLEPEDGVH